MVAHHAMRSARRIRRRLPLCLALVISAAVAATSVGNVEAFHTKQHIDDNSRPIATVAVVIAFVRLHGWPADLGYLCKGLALSAAGNKCLFRQISIHAKTAELDDHGFGVPIDEVSPSQILIYHVTPLAGEFFLTSKDGKLIKAIFRARGTDFEPMSDERSSVAFQTEMTFWQSNFAQIESDVLGSKAPSTAFPEQRQ